MCRGQIVIKFQPLTIFKLNSNFRDQKRFFSSFCEKRRPRPTDVSIFDKKIK